MVRIVAIVAAAVLLAGCWVTGQEVQQKIVDTPLDDTEGETADTGS